MDTNVDILAHMYDRFNARDIDGVLTHLAADVAWANGMDGGFEHGLDAVRAYWTRQWAIIRGTVEPLRYTTAADGVVTVTVRQTIRDLDGRPLDGQSHGLHDRTVAHVFHFHAGKVIRFEIADVLTERVDAPG